MSFIKSIYKFLSPKYQNLFLEYKVDVKPRYDAQKGPHALLYQIINENRNEYAAHLKNFLSFKETFHSIKTDGSHTSETETEPYWNNQFLPGLDIISLYGFLSLLKPKNYIEIGSGNSTKVARKAINDHQLATKITSVDPYPRAVIDSIADKIHRIPLEKMDDLSFVDSLEENDILFIDNSHRCFPNSDVTVCFLELIPRLKKGVIIHIHDMYLPYDYPQFMCDRFYSEQYLLATMLLSNKDRFQIMMPCFFVSEDKELKTILNPIWENPNLKGVERHGGSFWFKKLY